MNSLTLGNIPHSQVQQTTPAAKLVADSNFTKRPSDKPGVTVPAVATDQTSLSAASSLISKALSLADVRADKVAGLQQAIASGTYKVSSTDVADKVLNALLG